MAAGIASIIINRFNRKITVDVSPEAFVFSDGRTVITVGTYLYLGPNSKGDYLILAIGEPLQEAGGVRVNLFDPKSVTPGNVLRSDCLGDFLRFGFAKLSSRKIMLRPTVIFRGDNSLSYITCGYQKKLLSDAANRAGAHSVTFLD